MQEGSTKDMIFGVAETIAWLSRTMTLVPGDIIATGTPAGVGGFKGLFLRDGDTVEVEVEGLGAVTQPGAARRERAHPRGRGVPRRAAPRRPGDGQRAGRPRQSVVYFVREGDRLLISTEAGRWKARDVAAHRLGLALRPRRRAALPLGDAGRARPTIITQDIGRGTAAIAQNVMGLDEPPEPQSDAALADVGRVILAIDIERVGPVSYVGT